MNAVSKSSLRNEARARRATLTRADFADAIARFADDLPIAPGAVIAGYHPIRDEADPRGMMSALGRRGHILALPVIAAANAALVFRQWNEGEALRPNAYGIAEPLPAASEIVPDVVLVPLLAFDALGHRLGYGGGYYDRTLDFIRSTRRVLAIGVAYTGQEIAQLPRDPHDHRLDWIVTETGARAFTTRAE
jgi:5-formyltetrahydrofolate cyclo-ligase